MKKQLNEIAKMQKLAGILKEYESQQININEYSFKTSNSFGTQGYIG